MKYLAAIVLWLIPLTGSTADLVISNNAIICGFGDSQDADTSGAPSTGYMRQHYIHSYFALNYPQYTIPFYDVGRSGGTMDDRLTNILEKVGLPCWGFQSNNFQHIGISFSTDNADLSSNLMYLAQSNMCLAPGLMSDGAFPLTTQTGWAATHPVQWIVAGSDPEVSVSGGDVHEPISQRDRDAGCTNAGINFGAAGVTLYYPLEQGWTNDAGQTGGNTVGIFAGTSKAGHIEAPGQLNMAIAFLQQITTDTNISTCTIDWNTTVVATNHCVLSGASQAANILTFNRLDDRLPMAWDISSTDPTNNATPAFTLVPSQADAFRFTLQITNLPPGSYRVRIDGVTVADNLPSAALANGWNMFTNTVGPYWNQRYEVLGRIRDFAYVDRQTRVPGSAGDDTGEVSMGSQANAHWLDGVRGDALIAIMNDKVAHLQTNTTFSIASIHAAAQPTNHTFTITLAAPIFAPFHR
jgi:hypothetical protein